MRERPILFSSPMVRAILDGRKTQTRRIMAPQPDHLQRHEWKGELVYEGEHRLWCWKRHTFENLWDGYIREDDRRELSCMSPYGVVGDRLWVRETFTHITGNGIRTHYRADGEPTGRDGSLLSTEPGLRRWMPSIFMPRNESRITLEVSEVRVQRLQEISEEDARAEGVEPYTPPHGHISPEQRVPGPGFDRARLGDQPHRLPFADLWDRINGKRATWESNPWVWCLTFRRVS